jgi:DNA-binding GntR family transcriptional regulator
VVRAYEAIRDLITAGHLAPGSRVVERDLARRLGMSPTPVRAALHRLDQQGYLVTTAGGRAPRVVVAPLRRADMAELYFLIGDLEGWAALRSAELPRPQRHRLVDALAEINLSLGALAGSRSLDVGRSHDLDAEWHRAIVAAGAGPRLLSLLATLKPQADRYDRMYVASLGDSVAVSVAEHRAVERAISRGDGEGAREAMMTHWNNSAERLGRVIDARGESESL